MDRNKKSALAQGWIGPVLLILGGLLLWSNPDAGSAAVTMVIGWVLVALGGVGLLVCVVSWPLLTFWEILTCAFGLGLGIYLLRHPLSLAAVLGLAAGVWLVLQGAGMFWEGWQLRERGFSTTGQLLLGGVMVLIGVVFLVYPLTTSQIFMRLAGAAMMAFGVGTLVFRVRASRRYRDDDIIDADE